MLFFKSVINVSTILFWKEIISGMENLKPVSSSISSFKSVKPNIQFAAASSSEWRTESIRLYTAKFSVCRSNKCTTLMVGNLHNTMLKVSNSDFPHIYH